MKTPFIWTEQVSDGLIFDACARAWPHEIHAIAPERFWQFFQRERPGISRERMEQILKGVQDGAL